MINMTESCRHRMPGRMLQIYLLMRVMRMLVSMIVMLVYCVAVREEARVFLLTFIANYLIYLIYDSWFFFTFEANRKLKRKVTMKRLRNILTVVLLALGMLLPATVQAENTVDVKEIVFGHIGDSYEWHITTWGETHVTIPLPVIVHSSTTGWHTFYPHVWRRTVEVMKAFPSLPQEASTKASLWSMMPPETKYARWISPSRR